MPGILEWPGKVNPGSVTEFPSSTLDYFPTVMDVLGFPLKGRPNPIDGVSLLPMLDGTITERPQPIGFQSAGQVSLVDNRFKLIRTPARKRGGHYFFIASTHCDPTEAVGVHPTPPPCRFTELLSLWNSRFLRDFGGRRPARL